jgi:hypothetical protein
VNCAKLWVRTSILPFVLVLACAAGCQKSPGEMSCAELSDEYIGELQGHDNTCQTRDDCGLMGGTNTCNCAPSVGDCNGDVIATAGSERLTELARAFGERCLSRCLPELPCVCDCAATNYDCVAGRCQPVGSPSCF